MGTLISTIVWAIVLVLLIIYLLKGKSCGHVSDLTKPLLTLGFVIGTIIFIIILACTSCATKYVPIETTRYVTKTETIRDTIVSVKLEQSEKIVYVNIADKSHLQNKYCASSAYVKNGKLYHNLSTNKALIDVNAKTKQIYVRDSIRVPVPYAIPKHELIYKEKPLNWYQSVCVWLSSIIFGLLGIYIIYKLFKWRSNIAKFTLRLFKK